MTSERDILHQTLLTLGSRPDLRAWRQQSGVFVPMQSRVTCPHCRCSSTLTQFSPSSPTRVGVPGLSDVFVLQKGGRAIFVECKSDTGRQRQEQQAFQETVERFGARYIIARSAREASEAIK